MRHKAVARRYTYENAAAYPCHNASQVRQKPGDPRHPDRRPMAFRFFGETRRAEAVEGRRLRQQIRRSLVRLFLLPASITMRGVLVASSP
jgi:hypothetical protein